MKQQRMILLADCQSFYASVEKADHPAYAHQPLIVAGDPTLRSGIVLAACPIAKQFGITTAQRLGEALAQCPELIVMRPRMEHYINVSMQITAIYETYTDLVEPYSIDEQHLDITGSIHLFGSAEQIAKNIQKDVLQQTGIYVRVGISENKILAKMACDLFAKRNDSGIFHLPINKVPELLWPLPIHNMFMVGNRMGRNLTRIGIHTIGQLAQTSVKKLQEKWGINGELLWQIANGQDDSPVTPTTHATQKAIGHQITLPIDYDEFSHIMVPLLELAELVCQRARVKGYMGYVVAMGCQGANFSKPSGFYRQMKLTDPTNMTKEVFQAAKLLFRQHWDGNPIRKISITLSQLISDQEQQLTLFEDRYTQMKLEKTIDQIKQKYGPTAIIRTASLTMAGQIQDRVKKIGGHYKQ